MKRFLYACAAVLCLTLVYHFGATNAQGQVGSYFQVIDGAGLVRVGATIYATNGINQWRVYPRELPPVAVTSLVYLSETFAITDSGEGWHYNTGSSGWTSLGPVPGGATPATQSSWGQVKARYR